jgi:hypothetical protein
MRRTSRSKRRRCASASALERVLSQPRSSSRPLVIGVHIDPAQYLAQF